MDNIERQNSTNSPNDSARSENVVDRQVSRELRWRRMLKWIVLGNPFYPLSAVLVLLGVFLLSGEERMFGSELNQLYFNFGSVEFYGLLVASTAVFLFRRQIYYDTLILVVLATVPLLVPFVLISQAALLGNGIMVILCSLAAGLGLVQCWVIRKRVFELPLNSGITAFVMAILGLNLAMPIAIKIFHAEADAIVWAVTLDQIGPWIWRVVLPAFVVGGFFVPEMNRRRFGDCRVGWLPLVLILLLIGGSALHLCSLGYVYTFLWKTVYAFPTVWIATWLIWWRRAEWAPEGTGKLSQTSILVPGFFGFLPFIFPITETLFVLNFANLIACAAIVLRAERVWEVRTLVAVSLAGAVKSMPTGLLMDWVPNTTHAQLLMLVASGIVFVISLFKRTPGWGIAAAISVIFPLNHLWLTQDVDWPVVGQFALVTWWLHSLGWDFSERQSRALQTTGFVVWCLQSLIWFSQNGGEGRVNLALVSALFALSAALMIWIRRETRYSLFFAISLLVVGLNGVGDIVTFLQRIPFGLITLIVGLLVFGIGTFTAQWRNRLQLHRRADVQQSFDGNNI